MALAAAAEGDVAPAADPLTATKSTRRPSLRPSHPNPVKPRVRWDYYVLFILIMAVLTSGYTIFGVEGRSGPTFSSRCCCWPG